MTKSTPSLRAMAATMAAAIFALALGSAGPVKAGDIIADWNTAKAPTAPELKKVTVSPKDTALIVMDLLTSSCNVERRPRCLDTLAPVAELMKRARAKGLPVIHTLSGNGTLETLLKEVAPVAGEPYVKSSVDKFFKTDLEDMLKAKAITNVILVGTTAEGAVLATAMASALRGYKVIIPVDGMSAADTYSEQYVAMYLTKAPGVATATTLTRGAMIDIQ